MTNTDLDSLALSPEFSEDRLALNFTDKFENSLRYVERIAKSRVRTLSRLVLATSTRRLRTLTALKIQEFHAQNPASSSCSIATMGSR
jgi:hypothetical protein